MKPVSNRIPRMLSVLLLPLFVAACGDDTITTPTSVPVVITETFTGTLTKNGGTTYSVGVGPGAVTATLSSVAPDNTIPVGLAIGTWNGLSCALSPGIVNDKALSGASVVGSVNTNGSVCVRVYDVGNVSDPLNYEVKVQHF